MVKDQKLGIFIDAENVEISASKVYRSEINYRKIFDILSRRTVIRYMYYKPVHLPIASDFEKYFEQLGGEVRQPSKNADLYLAVDAITMAEKLDVIVLIGGDKDYAPLLWFLKSKGCKVEVWAFPDSTATSLIEIADDYVPMDEKFILGRSSSNRPMRKPRRNPREDHRPIIKPREHPEKELKEVESPGNRDLE